MRAPLRPLALLLAALLASLILAGPPAWGQEQPPAAEQGPLITLFWRPGCAHCQQEKDFLARLAAEVPGLRVQTLNLDDPAARPVYDDLTARLGLPRVAPLTVIGNRYLVGYAGEASTGAEIRRLIQTPQARLDLEQVLLLPPEQGLQPEGSCQVGPENACVSLPPGLLVVDVPLWGPVDLAMLTLPALSLVLGLVDGFNPCAMWVLVAFLTALLQVGSLRRMAQFAGIFILAEALMYLAILNWWFLAFDFIQADRIVTPLVGLLALGGGAWFIYESRQRGLECRVGDPTQRAATIGRLQALATRPMNLAVVLGILGLALSVNVVEFACSIGIPQTYTKILEMNAVAPGHRLALMGLYILGYMADDLLVFGLAIWGAEKIGLTTARYTRWSNLVGGIIMVMLGLVMLLAPEWLRF
ncbi:MAG: glutaredoxin [Desulfarculus sp.]|nr:glutaredoxin [Desulfarculus sp.]